MLDRRFVARAVLYPTTASTFCVLVLGCLTPCTCHTSFCAPAVGHSTPICLFSLACACLGAFYPMEFSLFVSLFALCFSLTFVLWCLALLSFLRPLLLALVSSRVWVFYPIALVIVLRFCLSLCLSFVRGFYALMCISCLPFLPLSSSQCEMMLAPLFL